MKNNLFNDFKNENHLIFNYEKINDMKTSVQIDSNYVPMLAQKPYCL